MVDRETGRAKVGKNGYRLPVTGYRLPVTVLLLFSRELAFGSVPFPGFNEFLPVTAGGEPGQVEAGDIKDFNAVVPEEVLLWTAAGDGQNDKAEWN